MPKRIVILAGDGETTPYVVEHLMRSFEVPAVIIEAPVARSLFLKRRIKKCGWWSVIGQIKFSLFVVPFLASEARSRMAEIKKQYGFGNTPIPGGIVTRVSSINDDQVSGLIKNAAPDYVVVWGTRILSKSLIEKITVPIINIHVGITPMYRGSHGGYWALYHNDPEHCGVTVHLIDEGIDTGEVLAQGIISVTRADNFTTYPLFQLGKGLELLADILKKEKLEPYPVSGPFSKIWYHPTVWQYIAARLFRKVK